MQRFLVALTCCVVGCTKPGAFNNGHIESIKESDGITTKVTVVMPRKSDQGEHKFVLNNRAEADNLIKHLELILKELKLARDEMPVIEPKPEPKTESEKK